MFFEAYFVFNNGGIIKELKYNNDLLKILIRFSVFLLECKRILDVHLLIYFYRTIPPDPSGDRGGIVVSIYNPGLGVDCSTKVSQYYNIIIIHHLRIQPQRTNFVWPNF